MDSVGESTYELCETDQQKADLKRKLTSKIAPYDERRLENIKNEESDEDTLRSLRIFNKESLGMINENEEDNHHEESKDGKKISKPPSQESKNIVFTKNKPAVKDKDSSNNEDESEEDKNIETLRKSSQPSAQVDECYYSQLKDGDTFKLQDKSYNLHTSKLYIGSKVRLVIGRGVIYNVERGISLPITTEDSNKFDAFESKVVDAIILPPLNEMWKFMSEETNLCESLFDELGCLIVPYLINRSERIVGNLILDKLYDDDLFLDRLLFHYRDDRVVGYPFYGRFTLYEIKDGKLVRPIDYYIKDKPLDYKDKFEFKAMKHESNKFRDKKLTEFSYKSASTDDVNEI
jgi:hypothetical protein